MSDIRYSPKPKSDYRMAGGNFFLEEPDAWNLAWLSWDWEKAPVHPDNANFSTNLRRTLQQNPTTGSIDLTGMSPVNETVRWFMQYPPPKAFLLLSRSVKLKELRLYKAYGDVWLESIEERSHAYREPLHPTLDFKIQGLAAAITVLERIKGLK